MDLAHSIRGFTLEYTATTTAMRPVHLEPSDILYSQKSINNYFDSPGQLIGETLDDLCEGRVSISDIPPIRVLRQGNDWITADNRRLWVFQNLERLGRCDYITAHVVDSIKDRKMTSTTGGTTIKVRGDPGGYWHRRAGLTDTDSDGDCMAYDRFEPERLQSAMNGSNDESFGSTLAKGVLIGGALLACGLLFGNSEKKEKK